MVVGETRANGHWTTTPGAELVSLDCQRQSGPCKAWQSEPTVAFGRFWSRGRQMLSSCLRGYPLPR